MQQSRILLFSFILVPTTVFLVSINTGSSQSKSVSNINTDGQNVVIQNNSSTAVSNTGNQSGSESISTGNSSAVSEVNINNGKVDGELKIETNGEKKSLKINKPGNYKLGNEVTNQQGNIEAASSQSKTKENLSKPTILSQIKQILDSIFRFWKK